MHYYSVRVEFKHDVSHMHRVWERHFTDAPTNDDVLALADREHDTLFDRKDSDTALRVWELLSYKGIQPPHTLDEPGIRTISLASTPVATVTVTPIPVTDNHKDQVMAKSPEADIPLAPAIDNPPVPTIRPCDPEPPAFQGSYFPVF